MYVVKTTGAAPYQTGIIDAAYTFAYTALWGCTHFSEKEIEKAKEQIAEFFAPVKNKEEAFIIFCERVLLARKYVIACSKRFIPLPSVWLDHKNSKGFAGTRTWYEELVTARNSLPAYKSENRVLAAAVLQFNQKPTGETYNKWKNEVRLREKRDLFILFQLYALNYMHP